MTSPYINTELYAKVMVAPQQLNNDLYNHLKKNLTRTVLHKFNKYGFVQKIYKILTYSESKILRENFNCSVEFNVKYACRLCIPKGNIQIICQVDRVGKRLIKAINGPIMVVIIPERIDAKNFIIDNIGTLRAVIEDGKTKEVNIGDYIKVTLIMRDKNFNLNDDKILVLGLLDSMATEKEIEIFKKDSEITDRWENKDEDENKPFEKLSTINEKEDKEEETNEVIEKNEIVEKVEEPVKEVKEIVKEKKIKKSKKTKNV